MPLYVLSGKTSFVDTVVAALKTEQLKIFRTSDDLLAQLLESSRAKSDLLIVDLSSVPDASRLIEFVRGSSWFSPVRMIGVGTEEELLAMKATGLAALDAILSAPCRGVELALAAARLREEREGENKQ